MKTIADAAEKLANRLLNEVAELDTIQHDNFEQMEKLISAELAAIVEERDARIRQLEEQLAAAEAELRQRRSVEAAAKDKLSKGVFIELCHLDGDVLARMKDHKFNHLLYARHGGTIYAALSALVGVEREKQRKDGEG